MDYIKSLKQRIKKIERKSYLSEDDLHDLFHLYDLFEYYDYYKNKSYYDHKLLEGEYEQELQEESSSN